MCMPTYGCTCDTLGRSVSERKTRPCCCRCSLPVWNCRLASDSTTSMRAFRACAAALRQRRCWVCLQASTWSGTRWVTPPHPTTNLAHLCMTLLAMQAPLDGLPSCTTHLQNLGALGGGYVIRSNPQSSEPEGTQRKPLNFGPSQPATSGDVCRALFTGTDSHVCVCVQLCVVAGAVWRQLRQLGLVELEAELCSRRLLDWFHFR